MRAVDKGAAPRAYAKYSEARHDLAKRIGYYCSYCEMGTNNMIEVEHVHPTHHGGNELDWENFLLSCKYCNTIKEANNTSRTGYYWPDIDNTDLLYDYTLDNRVIMVKNTLNQTQQDNAGRLITLVGLDRYPGNTNLPTEADTRWRLRDEIKITAMSSYNRWVQVRNYYDSPFRKMMVEQIAETSLIGFYSLWCKIFEGEQDVLNEIDIIWTDRYHNYKESDRNTGARIVRANGQI